MRLLTRYILKELFLPFFFSLLIIVFVLFTNFLLRAIDRFLGKGLDVLTILEYLFLNLAWIIALAVPMAVLIATLMTFGRLSEDNEINAMRSSGISFLTIIRPAVAFGILVGFTLVYFNNFILPEMNFHARILSGDIYRKRPGLSVEPGQYIHDLPDYTMIIRDKKDDLMEDVRIFSKNNTETQTTISSKTGALSTIQDAIILTLYDGEIHELDIRDFSNYRRITFGKHKITLPADDLSLTRRDTSSRTDREMTVPMMLAKQKSYNKRIISVKKRMANSFKRAVGDSIFPGNAQEGNLLIAEYRTRLEHDTTMTVAKKRVKSRRLKTLERQVKNEFNLLHSYTKSHNKYGVEIHKKFSLPFACILFVLVGTPLGVLAKRGGIWIAVILSFGFFLAYYIFMIGGEELADRNIVSPAVGMWTPNVLLFIIGIYLIVSTVRERTPIHFDWTTLFIAGDREVIVTYRNNVGRAKFITTALHIFIALTIVAIFFDVAKVFFYNQLFKGQQIAAETITPILRIHLVIAILQALTFLTVLIGFIRWLYRANQNLHSAKVPDLEFSPKWSFLGFFIPVLNLFIPFEVTREVWKGSKAIEGSVDFYNWKNIKTPPLIGWWWTLCLLSAFLCGYIIYRLSAGTQTEIQNLISSIINTISDTFYIPAAILTVILIKKITSLQKKPW